MASSSTHRTTLHLSKQCVYEGHVTRSNARCGTGTLYVQEGDGLQSALRCVWKDDMPHGAGQFIEPGGGSISGVWSEGALEGMAREEHADGTLRFFGHYSNGGRDGDGLGASGRRLPCRQLGRRTIARRSLWIPLSVPH